MRSRRQVLRLAAGSALLPALPFTMPGLAKADAYPTRPVRVIVAVSPGGTTDLAARVMAQWLTKRLGQPFVIENRPGGATNIGTEAAVRSPPDGYTLFMANSSNAVNETLYPDIGFKFSADLTPVAVSIRSPLVMLVNPSVPATTAADFIAYAKADPSKVNMGSGGKGATGHVAGELFQMMAGVKFQHIPYRGEAPAMTDLIGGQVQLVFATTGSSLPYVKAGKLRALAVTTATRAKDLPEVPPLADVLPGYEASSWSGFVAPKSTPTEIIDKLNRELNASAVDLDVQARFADLGGPPVAASPADFGRIIAGDVAKWAKVIKAAGLTGD
jgi:tripartite-type tricarboxylate transporter receptor subunit TctC